MAAGGHAAAPASGALAAAIGALTFGRAFNIGGGGAPTSVNTLLRIVARLCDVEPAPTFEPPRAGDVRLTEADISLAHDLLGYVPKVGIEEGLARTVDAFRSAV